MAFSGPSVDLGLGGSILGLAGTYSPAFQATLFQAYRYDTGIFIDTVVVWRGKDVSGSGLPGAWLRPFTPSSALGGATVFGGGDLPEGGFSMVVDGVDDYLTQPGSAFSAGPTTEAVSIEAVLTINATPGVGVEPAIWGWGEFGLTYKNDGRIYGYYDGSAVVDAAASTGSQVHVVLTRTGASPNDLITLYINGVSVDTATPARASLSENDKYAGKHWANAHYLSATYRYLAIHASALSSANVADNYSALSWTDVTSDTRGTVPLIIERGIRGDSPSQRVASTGTCTFALNNLASNSGGVTGYYSPGHASCRAGFAKGIPVRVRSGSDTLFVGKVRKIAPTPGKESGVYTMVTAADFMDTAANSLLENANVSEDVRADDVFRSVVALIPSSPNGVQVYQGNETYTVALDNTRDEEVSALREFVRITNSELGYIYLRRTGALVHEARTTRLANNATAQVTLSDTMHGLDVAEVANSSLNRVQLTVHPRVVDAAATTVLWALVNPLEIAAGETKTLIGPYRTASSPGITTRIGGISMVTPVSTTDYTMNDVSDGSGTDRTASLSVTANYGPNGVQWQLTNNHTGRAYITKLQCRGKGVYDFRTVVLRSQDSAAIASDGVNALNIDMVYQEDPNVAQALADDLLTAYGDLSGTRARTVSMLLGDPGLPADLHLYDISDRIALSETITGASGDYYINGVRLECQSGRLPLLKWWLAPAEFPVALTAVAYNASNFAATGGGSITVDSGDQITYAYQVQGKVMDLFVWLDTMDVTGTVTGITVAIPGGYVANRTMGLFGFITDAGTVRDANCRVASGGTVVTISRADGSNFTATSSDNTAIRINARFEVQ